MTHRAPEDLNTLIIGGGQATGDTTYTAENVIVAMASYQEPKTPGFATDLDANIVQLHVHDYKNPEQLQDGGVLVVSLATQELRSPRSWSRTGGYRRGQRRLVHGIRPRLLLDRSARLRRSRATSSTIRGRLSRRTATGARAVEDCVLSSPVVGC